MTTIPLTIWGRSISRKAQVIPQAKGTPSKAEKKKMYREKRLRRKKTLTAIKINGRTPTNTIDEIKRQYDELRSEDLFDFAETASLDEMLLALESYGHTPFVC